MPETITPEKTALELWMQLEWSFRQMQKFHKTTRTYKFACKSYEAALNGLEKSYAIPPEFIDSRIRIWHSREAGHGS